MTKKYRPAFSESQILLIKDKFSNSTSYEEVSIFRYLTKFCRDISSGYKNSSYSVEKKSIEESIGLISPPSESSFLPSGFNDLDPAEKRLILFNLWKEGKALSQDQIKMVQTYRFENNLMSPEEEAEFLSI